MVCPTCYELQTACCRARDADTETRRLRAALERIATYEAGRLERDGSGSVYVIAVARAALRGDTMQ